MFTQPSVWTAAGIWECPTFLCTNATAVLRKFGSLTIMTIVMTLTPTWEESKLPSVQCIFQKICGRNGSVQVMFVPDSKFVYDLLPNSFS